MRLALLIVLAWGFSVVLGQGLPGSQPSAVEIGRDLLLSDDLVQIIDMPIPVVALTTNQVSMTILMKNGLPLPMQITGLQGTAGLNGQTLATFAQQLDNFTIPALGGTATTPIIQPVTLNQGLDVQLALNITVLQILGIPILPFCNFPYMQLAAPTTYHLELCSRVEMQPAFELETVMTRGRGSSGKETSTCTVRDMENVSNIVFGRVYAVTLLEPRYLSGSVSGWPRWRIRMHPTP
ncbi:hypothetical protein EXIGLDRAFT_705296 [Exidia glandulosa HHB12029]|uniref:Uncharacterized protein n=1 Tax=Exidia glandulosa HHB12029 TaxID=1314781 RepID=A0A165PUR9_EXIGL|nr:hypothetical protein EXIGLDRAFT_705296 [Exidia glandulosa HHB12029]